ncbi:MAG: S8 family serine peptidase [Acidimicrobiia bacterium]|nr:S8 family serine peptidase [Acidimicrobiia bacterium]
MPGRRIWSTSLAIVVVASLLSSPAVAQGEPERSVPIDVNRDSFDEFGASLAQAARSSAGKVTVRVDYTGRETDARQSVSKAGGRVLASGGSSFKVELPVAALRGLERAPGIASVREMIPPAPLAVKSQGVGTTGANTWHALGMTGIGVKVAVVDFGFAGRAEAVTSGDLPGSAITKNYCSNPLESGGAHGTGVAEIVYDIAPAAQLYLVCVDDEFDLEAFVDYAIAQGIDIINHSGAWFLSDRGDGTAGAPSASNAARRADEADILWVAAAGNYTQDHWKGAWNPITIGGVTLQRFGSPADFDLSTVVPSGGRLSVFLKWDNWPTTREDLDLYLWDLTGSTPLAWSFGDQADGQHPQPPVENMDWVNATGVPKTVYIEVRAHSVNNPGELDMLVFGQSGLEYPVATGSIADPAFSPHTVAVGASCFADNQIEYFSSLGPTIDGRIKPDFVSADGVITRAFGGTAGACDGFIGTSASAPHVSGLAALIMHAAPNWTPDRVVQALQDYSLDLGPKGKDNTFGFGNVVLGAVPAEDCRAVPTPVTGIVGPGTVVDTYNGSAIPAGSYLVKNNDGSLSLCIDPGTPASAASATFVPLSFVTTNLAAPLRQQTDVPVPCMVGQGESAFIRCRTPRFGVT